MKRMNRFAIFMLMLIPLSVFSQEERKHIREGYKAYIDGNYNEAEIEFRKAEDINHESFEANYNTSAALYKQEKLEESGQKFSELLAQSTDKKTRAQLFHNMGNVFLKGEKYQEAAEAFKQGLRLNPDDEDTRYNLAYALEKLREQEQQQQQQNNDQNEDQENQDQQDQNQQDQNQQNQDDQQQQDQQDQQQQEQEQQQAGDQEEMQDEQQQALSKEEAERLLQAILQNEKDVKEKVDKQRAKKQKIRTDKDW